MNIVYIVIGFLLLICSILYIRSNINRLSKDEANGFEINPMNYSRIISALALIFILLLLVIKKCL